MELIGGTHDITKDLIDRPEHASLVFVWRYFTEI